MTKIKFPLFEPARSLEAEAAAYNGIAYVALKTNEVWYENSFGVY